jgi:hypothetical protein
MKENLRRRGSARRAYRRRVRPRRGRRMLAQIDVDPPIRDGRVVPRAHEESGRRCSSRTVVRHVKSNAIVYARADRTVGKL